MLLHSDTAGNETMTPHQIVLFLNKTNFDIYADHWNEQDLYFGRHHQKVPCRANVALMLLVAHLFPTTVAISPE